MRTAALLGNREKAKIHPPLDTRPSVSYLFDEGAKMKTKTIYLLWCLAIAMLIAQPAYSEAPETAEGRCAVCDKTLGSDAPESALSADPDFKQHNMFQCCQTCLDKKMDKQAQRVYTEISRKYKWSSISHNKSVAFKANRRSS